MIGKKVSYSKLVPIFEVKDLVKERVDQNDKGIEPTYEQRMVLEYTKRFAKLTPAKGKKLLEDLKKFEGLPENAMIKIVDILPEDTDEITLLLSKQDKVSPESLKEIIELIKKYKA